MDGSTNYARVFVDFNSLSKTEFFRLGDRLSAVPNISLRPRKRHHRFGIIKLLLKLKSMLGVQSGAILYWEDLGWRPIQSYYNYTYGPWLRHMGRAMSVMSKVLYPMGDSVSSSSEVQSKAWRHNKRHCMHVDQS